MIFISELGDRTFFIVIVYSAKFNGVILFFLASFCMVFMHTLSTTLGTVLAVILPKLVTSIIVVLLFFGFGFALLIMTCKEQNCFRKDPKTGKRLVDPEGSADELENVLKEVEEHEAELKALEE